MANWKWSLNFKDNSAFVFDKIIRVMQTDSKVRDLSSLHLRKKQQLHILNPEWQHFKIYTSLKNSYWFRGHVCYHCVPVLNSPLQTCFDTSRINDRVFHWSCYYHVNHGFSQTRLDHVEYGTHNIFHIVLLLTEPFP